MSKSLEKSNKFFNENPQLLQRYAKALSEEFKKPVKDQRPASKVALESVKREKVLKGE